MSAILRIEHPVEDFERWRRAFHSDPVGRERGGVRAYRIMRPPEDERLVLIDLEFEGLEPAQRFLASLRELWEGVDFIRDPKARVVKVVEASQAPSAAAPLRADSSS